MLQSWLQINRESICFKDIWSWVGATQDHERRLQAFRGVCSLLLGCLILTKGPSTKKFVSTEKINNGGYVIPNDAQFEMITLCRNRSKKSKERS